MATPEVDQRTDGIADTAAAGVSSIQSLFEEGMARLAVISLAWQEESRKALESGASTSKASADPDSLVSQAA